MDVHVLCVDPSITNWGYSIFASGSWQLVDFKTIKYSAKLSREKRWSDIVDVIERLTRDYNVKLILTEYQFGNKFDQSLLQTVAMCGMVAGKMGIDIRYISPASWKKWGLNNAKIGKKETIEEVSKKFPQLREETEHVCDSVAIMLSFINNPKIGLKKG